MRSSLSAPSKSWAVTHTSLVPTQVHDLVDSGRRAPRGGGGAPVGMLTKFMGGGEDGGMLTKFLRGGSEAGAAGGEAASSGAGGGWMAAAGPWAALAAVIAGNEYSANKAGRRREGEDWAKDAFTGRVLQQDMDYYGDKVGGVGGDILKGLGKLGSPFSWKDF